MNYGDPPETIGTFDDVELVELCRYLYMPIWMPENPQGDVRMSLRLHPLVPLVRAAMTDQAARCSPEHRPYVYLTVARGYATPDNPLNRPGWHCDGFGSDDINYVWWDGPGTRFATGSFLDVDEDHVRSMEQFHVQIEDNEYMARRGREPYVTVSTPPAKTLYRLTPFVVHATPVIEPPGCWRTFVKISFSTERYNLLGNTHNYSFDYDWKMWPREVLRNDPAYGEQDFYRDA